MFESSNDEIPNLCKYFHELSERINLKSRESSEKERDLPLLGAKYKLAPSTVIPTSKYVAENTQFTRNCVPSPSSIKMSPEICYLMFFSGKCLVKKYVFFLERDENTVVFPKQALFSLLSMLPLPCFLCFLSPLRNINQLKYPEKKETMEVWERGQLFVLASKIVLQL